MLNRHKNWLVHKQTACGKDFSNPFMVDNLPKIVRFSTHLASVVKSWLVHDQTVHALASPNANELTIPEQTATGKGTSNPLMAGNHIPSLQEVKDYLEMKRMQNVPYASAVGSIMYVVRCTRPDVAFAQNITSRFQQNPGEAHWTAVKNILKYLRNTKDTFLVYGGNPEAELQVKCYCDAGFETDRDDTKSQTRFIENLTVVPSNDISDKGNL
ncbi:hypothetical protein Tco_1568256 [Tanacetum coccineum]